MLDVMVMTLAARERRSAGTQLAAGDVLGDRYELLQPVGRGGASIVWRAHDRLLSRFVAVKVHAASPTEHQHVRQQLRNEAATASAVSHPGMVGLAAYGEDDRDGGLVPFLAMELLDGVNLRDRMNAGPVPPATAMRIGAGIASALAALHAAGVVHCDVKPANVMLVGDGVKLVDFGIATVVGGRPPGSRDVQVVGTPAYMSPERLLGDAVRPAADVYALGILMYRLLAGCAPWCAETATQVLVAHVSTPPAPMPCPAGVPPFVADLCTRCLAKDPAARPSADEVERCLSLGARTDEARLLRDPES